MNPKDIRFEQAKSDLNFFWQAEIALQLALLNDSYASTLNEVFTAFAQTHGRDYIDQAAKKVAMEMVKSEKLEHIPQVINEETLRNTPTENLTSLRTAIQTELIKRMMAEDGLLDSNKAEPEPAAVYKTNTALLAAEINHAFPEMSFTINMLDDNTLECACDPKTIPDPTPLENIFRNSRNVGKGTRVIIIDREITSPAPNESVTDHVKLRCSQFFPNGLISFDQKQDGSFVAEIYGGLQHENIERLKALIRSLVGAQARLAFVLHR